MFGAYDRGWEDGQNALRKTMYTEEEVKELLHRFHICTDGTLKYEIEWFEANKKKPNQEVKTSQTEKL